MGDEIRFYYSGMIKALILDKFLPGSKQEGIVKINTDLLLKKVK
jgi:hypothetical protein